MKSLKRKCRVSQYVFNAVWVYEILRFEDIVEVWFYNDQHGVKMLLFGTDDIKHRDQYYIDMCDFTGDVLIYKNEVIQND